MIASNVASPVHLFRTSAETASALNTRSGASRTQPPCASLCTRRTPRGSRGRASAAMAVGASLTVLVLRYEGAGRNVPGRHIGMIERIQHRPQYVAFEHKRGQHLLLLAGRA